MMWPFRKYSEDTLRQAHKHSIHHRAEIETSQLCGCFHCRATYPPSAITEWTDTQKPKPEQTAMCPECGIDAVLGDKSGFDVEGKFLRAMQRRWF